MGEIQVEANKNPSTLLDPFERLSVEIQLNQAMLRRTLSEPRSSFFPVGSMAPRPPPQLVRQPVEQGKRGSSWPWGFNKMVKKLIGPIVFRRRKGSKGGDHQEARKDEPNFKDLRSWKRFSKSVRL